jgi:GNAT superfamily N-acetyltransferase
MDAHLRPAGPDDVAVMAELTRRAEAHDRVPRVITDDDLARVFDASHVTLHDDTRVAIVDGDIVGYGLVWNPPASDRLERAELSGEVAPPYRGKGIGRALLTWSVDRARERFASRAHDLPRFIRVSSYDWLDDRRRLYERLGFDPVRWHEELLRSLDAIPPIDLPSDIVLEPWPGPDDGRDDELRQVRNEAFADHWNSLVVDAELWHDFVRGYGGRPDLSVVAIDRATGDVVGVCVNHAYPEDEAATGRRDAWIANVGTLRQARGRGVASAMIAWSLRAFVDAGFTHAVLDVDTESPTGAGRLYRNLGFEPHLRSITYEIEVPA